MDFYDFIFDVNSFSEFHRKMEALKDKNLKGKFFEQFAELYFKYFNYFDNYYRYRDIPQDIKHRYNWPPSDKGIDALGIKNGIFSAIQIKFSKKEKLNISKLKTFFVLCNERNIKTIIFASTKGISEYIIVTEYILYETLNKNCNNEFWSRIKQKTAMNKYPARKPRDFQKPILDKLYEHFEFNDKGKLICACGSGKTLLSFWLFNHFKFAKVCVFLSSKALVTQFCIEWTKELNAYNLDYKILKVFSENDGYDNSTTGVKEINEFMKNDKIIVFSTYHSSELLINYKFDLIVYDEAHRTCGDVKKKFCNSMKVEARKKLFMTATELVSKDPGHYSMDDKKCYGDIIYKYTLKQAIIDDNLCNYRIICVETEEPLNKNIFIPNIVKKCFDEYNIKHLIVYCETKDEVEQLSKQTNQYIKSFFIHEKTGPIDRELIIKKFKSEKSVIFNCNVLSEGIDLPYCDSILFSHNTQAKVRIIQCIGRCLRKYDDKKIAHIIIPFSPKNGILNKQSYETITGVLKAIYEEDNLVYNKLCIDKKYKRRKYKNRDIDEDTEEDEIKDVLKYLISNEYEKNGVKIDGKRKLILEENEKRFITGEDLIDTKEKAENFLNTKLPNDNRNWVEWTLGTYIFNKKQKLYYISYDEFLNSCKKLNIDIGDKDSYVEKYTKDKKLIPPEYLYNNFYNNNCNFIPSLFKCTKC